MTLILYCVTLAFLAGLVLVPLTKAAATRLDVVARPKFDRWHREPVPLLGGLAIAVIVLGGAMLLPGIRQQIVLLGCAALMAMLGLVDDLYELKSSTKLVFQIVVAAIFVYAGARLHWANSLTLDTFITLLWIVGVTNAVNLLDNMDGLAAGVSCIATVSMLLALAPDFPPQALVLALLLGASAAFLWFNCAPATIFMGDTGSLLIGFLLAAASISSGVTAGPRELLSVVAAPVLVLFIPLFDTTFVILARMLSGRSPSRGGRDHSSHRLVAMGLSERWAVLVLWALAGVGGAIGVLVRQLNADWAGVVAGIFVLSMAIFGAYLAGVRVYDGSVRPPPMAFVITEFMYKRRVLEVMLDLALVGVAYYCAYRLRFDQQQFAAAFPTFLQTMPVAIACQIAAQFLCGAYRGMWRYFGLMDAVVFARSVTVGTLALTFLVVILNGELPVPEAVFVIYATLLLVLLLASRASFRLMSEFVSRLNQGPRTVLLAVEPDEQYLLHRIAARDRGEPRRLVGFFEVEVGSARGSVFGYPHLGDYGDLLRLVSAGLTDEVIVSVTRIEAAQLAELEQHCRVHGVAVVRFEYTLQAADDQALAAASTVETARS